VQIRCKSHVSFPVSLGRWPSLIRRNRSQRKTNVYNKRIIFTSSSKFSCPSPTCLFGRLSSISTKKPSAKPSRSKTREGAEVCSISGIWNTTLTFTFQCEFEEIVTSARSNMTVPKADHIIVVSQAFVCDNQEKERKRQRESKRHTRRIFFLQSQSTRRQFSRGRAASRGASDRTRVMRVVARGEVSFVEYSLFYRALL